MSVSRSFFDRLGVGFGIDLESILEVFGIPNGGQDGPKMGKLGVKKAT